MCYNREWRDRLSPPAVLLPQVTAVASWHDDDPLESLPAPGLGLRIRLRVGGVGGLQGGLGQHGERARPAERSLDKVFFALTLRFSIPAEVLVNETTQFIWERGSFKRFEFISRSNESLY